MVSGGADTVSSGSLSGATDTEPSIAKKVKSCLRAFEFLCKAILEAPEQDIDTMGQISLDWTKDTLDRLKLWSEKIGAHHAGRRSLDYRPRDASNLRKQAIDLVGDMVQAVDDATAIISGARVPWDKQQSFDALDGMSLSSSEDEDTNGAEDQATGESSGIAVDSELIHPSDKQDLEDHDSRTESRSSADDEHEENQAGNQTKAQKHATKTNHEDQGAKDAEGMLLPRDMEYYAEYRELKAAKEVDKLREEVATRVLELVGDRLGTPAPDAVDDSDFTIGRAADFPTVPAEEQRNPELRAIMAQYNPTDESNR